MLLAADRERTPGAALVEMEQRFESSAGLPTSEDQMEPFFRLYRMRSSISYMVNRLGRLLVAKEAALPQPVGAAVTVTERVAL